MTHPGAPRDVDLPGWLDGIGFKPANTEVKQLAHEVARGLVGELGTILWGVLPPGRDKALVFTLLEDVLMRANRALALGEGPREHVTADDLRELLHRQVVEIPEDPRISDYKADQLRAGQPEHVPPAEPLSRVTYSTGEEPGQVAKHTVQLVQPEGGLPEIKVSVEVNDEGENTHESGHLYVDDPEIAE